MGSLSQISTVDLWAKVMPFCNAKGWLQQLACGFTCACMRGCRNHMSWHPCPISPFLCQSHSVTFSRFLSSCSTVCMSGIQNGIHLSVFTTHVHAPSWHSKDWGGDLVCISQQGGRPALASLSTIWNEIRSRGRLSLKIGSAQACARINLGYILLSCRSRSVSIPNRIQSPLNKNKRSFLLSLRIFSPPLPTEIQTQE